MASGSLALVPPRRLGALLRETRLRRGWSLDDLAGRSRFSAADLAVLEQGDRLTTDAELRELLDVYEAGAEDVVPERAELVIDLDEQRLCAGSEIRELPGGSLTPDEVLATYLSVVYTLRRTEPGTPIVLRDADVAVLSRALELAQPFVQTRLHELMVEPTGEVARRTGLLRARVLVPLAGIVVAATAVGVVLFVQADEGSSPSPPPAADTGPVPVAPAPSVDIGGAATQSRNPDGSPAAPVVRGGDGLDADQVPPGGVGLIDPQVATRNPDGSVNQTDREAAASTSSTEPPAGSSTPGG